MEAVRVAVHLRVKDRVRVLEALRAVMERQGLARADRAAADARRVLVAPSHGEWTAVYPEVTGSARDLARGLAAELKAPALVVGTIGEEALFYSAYDDAGDGVDDYHSCPDFEKEFGDDDASPEELERTRGDVDRLAELLGGLGPGADLLRAALAEARLERLRDVDAWQQRPDVEEVLVRLRDALKLPPFADYEEMVSEGEDGLDVRVLAFRKPRAERGFKLPFRPRGP
ncbi:MAG: hypothetical protein KF878_03085 [Planctomycetes bacterium]|nr:hypothetical protein [Planctomycetota bacterium]